MSQEDKPCSQHPNAPHGFDRNASHNAGRYVCECEGWEPVAAQEPETESFVQTVPDHCDRIVWKGTYIHLPIANAAPCARCKELECDVAHWKANHDNRVEAARLLIDRPDLPLERVKAYQAHIALQAKITEQAAEIARINRIASCGSVDSWMSLSDDDKRKWFAVTLDVDQKKADRIKALEDEAAERESFLKTLADTCTEAERIAIERAGRIDALEAGCRKLRDAISETEALCKRKDITIERQRKVIDDSKAALNRLLGSYRFQKPDGYPKSDSEKLADAVLSDIAELEQGVV